MAVKEIEKSQTETITLEVPSCSDLSSRIENITKQTGLATADLFQKWVLQEESLIGLMQRQRGGEQTAEQTMTGSDTSETFSHSQPIPGVQKLEETVDPDSPKYRKILIKMAKKLKKEGLTLVKIAEVFNAENVRTISCKGKWYSSSIMNLLK